MDILRIYFECGILVSIFLLIMSDGNASISDCLFTIFLWPVLVFFMLIPPGDDE